jgi:hypothetical protein
MKTIWRLTAVSLFLFVIILVPFMAANHQTPSQKVDESVNFFGITYGGDSVVEAKNLIDKVRGYTNLFVLDSWQISGATNSSTLDEICDYAVKANLSIIVYFLMIYYNSTTTIGSYNTSSWDIYGVTPWHTSWLNGTKERWGDKFLGAYLFDEPGGKQIDKGYWSGINVTYAGAPVSTFQNVTGYDDAANRYISSIHRNRGMQILTNTSYPNGLNSTIPVFTSDYALYWFDYQAGYSTIFAEIGGNRTVEGKTAQIGLCRGAAKAQNKDWGAIVTWANDNPPTPESGSNMLQDLALAYNAGAKYEVVFNYQINGSVALTEDNFAAMKQFWISNHSVQRPQSKQNSETAALVLPAGYGSGIRSPDDGIWGLWPADNLSAQIWQNTNTLIDQYGSKLDIIYDDPYFGVQDKYAQTFFWNSTTK